MKRIYQFALLVGAALSCVAASAQTPHAHSPLKVLFVGYDATRTAEAQRKGLDTYSKKDSIRMPAFKTLLSEYFAEVKTIDCRDWKTTDSDPYDVTIFDYATTALEKEEYSPNHYVAARYLPDNFSRPVVFIGSTADMMGRRIGLKLDWLCLCLDADAHHINTSHPIFNGPLEKVQLTMEMKETPKGIYEYPSGDTVPHKIPMWRVNTRSYADGEDMRIGLVSRGARFTESPDAERISSGVCLKDVTAVALGRHGNFFLWGFAASPATMTDEAKKVFVNVVAYMHQFDGQTPIARKYNDRMATTDDVLSIAGMATRQHWQQSVEETKHFNEQTAKEYKKLQDKKASGQTLTDREAETYKIYGNMKPMVPKTWPEYLTGLMGPFAKKFGTDAPAYQRYIKDNISYMYCDPQGFWTYDIDKDVQGLKIPNHSTRLLQTCIGMLKTDKDTALAMRVLRRYTAESFSTAAEWDSWFSGNKDKLFFTETGGYKFIVNTLQPSTHAFNDRPAGRMPAVAVSRRSPEDNF